MSIKCKKTKIDGIPAIIWGEESDKVYIHVHGKMSRKEYAEAFAIIADSKGYQTISFDLPEHGEREVGNYRCDIWNGRTDLTRIADYVYSKWSEVSLYACSLGAYFSLQTYGDRSFRNCLFQSPIVDMKWLVEHMMLWSDVTAEDLKIKGEIDTPIDTLRWDYYNFILDNPIKNWPHKTAVLYGALDNLQPIESIESFVKAFDSKLQVSPNSQHPFMEPADFPIVEKWLQENI